MGEMIHFRGKDAIIQAYESQGIPCCSMVSGRDIIFCYDGEDIVEGSAELADFIDRLKLGHSQGTYQLRVYKFPPKNGDINTSTKQNLSFKCRILDPNEDRDVTQNYADTYSYQKRIELLEAKLAESETIEQEDPEPIPVWQQTINGVLQRPDVQNFVMGKIFSFVEKIFGPGPGAAPAPAHAMNGVPEGAQAAPGEPQPNAEQLYQALSPQERDLLDAAMGILLANDPQIGTNLYKVASLLKSNPNKYRAFASMI
jgi:hypothetical protein